ncbi:unnamed protein product [Schistosoma rodhaini]|uniref:C2 domain-containing protein n=1 Tax=Schistosoma rodhaini TaxID=6188 RepID=A0AA85GAN5_9TREM|nr:unnamed protein product [Schistosoma rodhaini]
MSSRRKRLLEGNTNTTTTTTTNSSSSSKYLQNNEIESINYYHLTNNLFIILLGVLLIMILILLLIYYIYRRLRNHSHLLNNQLKTNNSNDDEYVCFTKSVKYPLTQYNTQNQTTELSLKSINIPLQSYHKSNDPIPNYTDNDGGGKDNDDEEDEDDDDDFNRDFNECKPISNYSKQYQTNYIKSNVIQSTQQYIESAELKRRKENYLKSINDQEKSETRLIVENNRKAIRRVSSTPNISKFINNQSNNVDINHLLNSKEGEDNGDNNDRSIDDHELFKVNSENEEDIVDFTLTDSNEDPTVNDTSESLENATNQLSFIPIMYPNWTSERGVPERGYITLAVRIEGDLSNIKKHPFLSVHIFDARCILSRNVEPKAGKFYVKARLQLAGINNSVSMLSLDRISTKSLKMFSNKMDIFTTNRSSSAVHSGRTPVKRAYRSPVFRHKIVLPLPLNIIDAINKRSTSLFESMESISPIDLEDGTIQNYELKIDLKERNACKTNDLHGTSTVQYLPYWSSSQLIGSVRIPITSKMWQYLMEDVNKLRRSTVVNLSTFQDMKTKEKSLELLPNKLLWFVRCLKVPDENANSRGEITFGMQYNQENGSLTISLFNCASMNLPKRTKNLFVRASLCSNWKLFRTVQSRPTARLSVNSAEFILGEKLNFIIEEDISSICIILSVFARSGSKLQEATTLIGRCVTGPSDLACGDGLSHWTSICSRQGMIRRTHILS